MGVKLHKKKRILILDLHVNVLVNISRFSNVSPRQNNDNDYFPRQPVYKRKRGGRSDLFVFQY